MIEKIILEENEKKKKEMVLTICEKKFVVSTFFSFFDMQIYINSIKNNDNSKKAIVEVIINKLKKNYSTIPNFDDVMNEKDIVFELYILELLKNSNEINKYYEKRDESLNVIERFSLANKECLETYSRILAEGMKPILDNISEIIKTIDYSGITNNFKRIGEVAIQFHKEYYESISNALSEYSTRISSILKNVKVPIINEEIKIELEHNYKLWGQMGWTTIPHAELNMFSAPPKDLQSADRIALKYFNKKGLESLFQKMRKQKIKKCDLESAIFCFENKQYKACSLILFGIIDSKMISLQSHIDKTINRKVGKRAVEKLEKALIQKCYNKKYYFITFYYLSLFECLNIIFANGGDFKEEPPIINRNFVSHGMNKRKVRRKDCIKVFLALYNFVEMLEFEWDFV